MQIFVFLENLMEKICNLLINIMFFERKVCLHFYKYIG